MTAVFNIFRKRPRAPGESVTDRLCRVMATPKKLLLVEDDDDIVATMAHSTEDYALELVAVDSVAGARHLLETDGPFEAAILDVRLVNGDGVTLYRHIVERWPGLKVVFMTGYASDYLREQIEQVGPARVFPKTTVLRMDFFEKLLAEVGISRRCVEA